LIAYLTATLVSFFVSFGKNKTVSPVVGFFLLLLSVALIYRYLIGELNPMIWGIIWLPALFLMQIFISKPESTKENAKKTLIKKAHKTL